VKVEVHAGEHNRSNCPVSFDLNWPYTDVKGVDLRDAKTRKRVPCQLSKAKGGVRLTLLVDGLKAGVKRAYAAKPLAEDDQKFGVSLVEPDGVDKVDVHIGNELFTSYHYGTKWVRPFLYPMIGPGDTQVTRSWPVTKNTKKEYTDHKHHKSLWVSYGECGRGKVDNWSEEPGHGYQLHQKFVTRQSGPVFGRIVAKNDWTTNAKRKQFEETRDMCFYALPGGVRLLDVKVSFKMTQSPITFYDTKEGGLLSVRVASSMDVRRGGKIENAFGGVNEDETWGKNSPWCDYSGTVDGKEVGIAVFDHEYNPRYPTGWHVRNYGLMTANCFAWKYYRPDARVKGDMTFKKGSTTSWQYRVYIHKGDATKGKVRDRYLDFAAPPKVTVK
jgi:hypothetical protein